MSTTRSLDLEKKGGSEHVEFREEDNTMSPAPKPRRSLLPWLACLALTLLVFACGRTVTCSRPSAPDHHVVPASDAVIYPAHPLVLGPGKHLGVEPPPVARRQSSYTTSSAAASPTVLECFQVAPRVLTPEGAAESDDSEVVMDAGNSASGEVCTQLLMEHSFANSYGQPFIGSHTPPSCAFNRVVMNFTVTSQGRQFDRLALMYLGDTEVWRTSTAEPVQPPGIRWTYMKDMTEYLSLWKTPQKLIFDLGNLINDKYTGPFNTTLTATFFTAEDQSGAAPPSDLIIPISKRQSAANGVSQFTLPADDATNTISFPRNARRAVFSVSSCGQAEEEFWWSNVLQSDVDTFASGAGSLYGYSPFREVQVLIDGQLAGVEWPFPVIFTGGVVPSLHRPIVGVDAFDLREHEIDITPFLPLLCDGAEHTFTIRVAGIDDTSGPAPKLTQTVRVSWYVTGKIFVWLDDEGSVTTGDKPTVQASAPTIKLTHSTGQSSSANGTTNETLSYTTLVNRKLATSARVKSQHSTGVATWSQTLSYTNKGLISDAGYSQVNDFSISGSDTAVGNNIAYLASYRYPLYANQSFSISPQNNLTIHAHVTQGKQILVAGQSVFPNGLEAFSSLPATTAGDKKVLGGSLLSTTKDGTAAFFQTGDGKNSSGYGTSAQVMTFGGVRAAGVLGDGPDVELYFRNVTAVNGTVVFDRERLAGDVGGAGVDETWCFMDNDASFQPIDIGR
ncbi:peptide N-acetyl-beta-D-glucosaminyl asparaginase amidase A-domain-containing protein [Coniochaeta sp. 2T2.1]|nr:peptide N-acetyl-beta-D-glucosaminyl asparaginase amidase A-domain-containing protein [Coniochaeta sp. 2T2.1]